MRVYLCGPINGCDDAECNDWRSEVKKHFPDTLDPMRRDYRGRESECVEEIVELDKTDVEDCDVVIANCPKPSVGTSMEVFYAWTLGKPVVAVVPAIATASPWLSYHASTMVEGIQAAVEVLKKLDIPKEDLVEHICTVGKDFRFEAAHSLPHLPPGHKCRNHHGHSYKFRVEIKGPVDERGFVVDYADISAALQPLLDCLDHCKGGLNEWFNGEHMPAHFFQKPTTAENLARYIHWWTKEKLGRCDRVTLWETPTSVVTYEPPM